jgi:hypothetical protein
MKPEHFSRHEQYLQTAKHIETAYRSYLEALHAIEVEEDEISIYAHVKKAHVAIEAAFPEKFTPPARPVSIQVDEAKKGKNLLLIIAIALGIIGILLSLTLFGPTGDMTKKWNIEDVQKNSAYPKTQ